MEASEVDVDFKERLLEQSVQVPGYCMLEAQRGFCMLALGPSYVYGGCWHFLPPKLGACNYEKSS